jgi:gamma-glutamylcyclotransferase (GGCT)/AIG2-like uncharacterized protein YtfP
MSQNIFTYGSNMCSGRFRAYRVHPESAGHSALLKGYRLLFNKRSVDGSGKANVEACEGAGVWGVLYSIPDEDLATLDDGEVGYERVTLPVRTADDAESQAWVYIASPANTVDGLHPYTWYKRFLVEGAREHALPAAYTATLEKIEAIQDTDAARDRRKRALVCRA